MRPEFVTDDGGSDGETPGRGHFPQGFGPAINIQGIGRVLLPVIAPDAVKDTISAHLDQTNPGQAASYGQALGQQRIDGDRYDRIGSQVGLFDNADAINHYLGFDCIQGIYQAVKIKSIHIP